MSQDNNPVPHDALEVDNSISVTTKIARLYAERLMSDVCFVVQDQEYPAHRLILCASSDVFQVMLLNTNWAESKVSRITLQEPPECAQVFGEFLAYFYTGRIKISHTSVLPLITLADKYNVKDLIQLCENFMLDHIPSAATCNQLLRWLAHTLSHNHAELTERCMNFVVWNFELVASQQDFPNCEPELMIHFLQHNDLVVHDEHTLYRHVVKWLLCQESRLLSAWKSEDALQHFSSLVEEVIGLVRFPMMSPRQLADLLLCPLMNRFKSFFVDRLATGMALHSRKEEQIQYLLDRPSGALLFTPRLYTTEKWTAPLVLENFSELPAYHNRTLLFSSLASCAEYDSDKVYEWALEFYPKMIRFHPGWLIVWHGMQQIPEVVYKTVRLSLFLKDPPVARVNVAVVVTGRKHGIEHVVQVHQKKFIFTAQERTMHMDNIIDYEDLNASQNNLYLTGSDANTLVIRVVIVPLKY